MSNFPDTPVTLVAKLAAQMTCQSDNRAWQRFFGLYEPAIRKFAEFQGAGSFADDIVQETFVRLVDIMRNGKYTADEGQFRCYLATLIRREVISNWRKRQVRCEVAHVSIDNGDAVEETQLAVDDQTAVILDLKWRQARHAAAVEHVLTKTALSEQSKDVYRAYVLEERSVEEVVSRFKLSRNSVYQIKTRIEKMVAAVEQELGE